MKKTITDELLSIKFPSSNNIFLKEKNIKKIDQDNKSINIEIELNFVAKKRLDELQQLIEKKISSSQGLLTKVFLTSKIKSHKVQQGLSPLKGVKNIVAIASGKGGVGKSTTSVNLAIALKLEGYNVGLLDADVYGPSQPRMLGVSGRPASVGGDMVAPLQNFGISLMSMGLLVPDDTAMIWRGPMVQSALTQMLNSVAWGNLDVIVIDLPPGTGDIQISLAQQVNLAGAVIVSTPQDIALLDVVKALTMFQKANVPVLGMIENMSYWSCPDCGRVDHIFGEGGVKAEAKKRDIELLGEIPISAEVRKSSDSGIPIIISEPQSIQSKNYRNIAKNLIKSIKLDEEELV